MEVYKSIEEDGILPRVFWNLHIFTQQNTLRHMSEESNLNPFDA